MEKLVNIEIGRGGSREGWVTVDIDKNVDPDVINDCRTLLSFEDESIDEIFSAHTLEHIYNWEVEPTLILWRRKLKKNGRITIFVPDTMKAWKMYFNSQLSDDEIISVMLGSKPNKDYLLHKTVFWYQRLEKIFYRAGLRNMLQLPQRAKQVEFGIQARKTRDESYFNKKIGNKK